MTATPSGPHIFPIGSYCRTALDPTRHRNKQPCCGIRTEIDGGNGRKRVIHLVLYKADAVTCRETRLTEPSIIGCDDISPSSISPVFLKVSHKRTYTCTRTCSSGAAVAPAAPLFCLLHPHLLFSLPPPSSPLTECQRAIICFERYTFIFRYSSENRHHAAPRELVFPRAPYHTDRSIYKSDGQARRPSGQPMWGKS